jgi:uroporphyrinogen decarboxylase
MTMTGIERIGNILKRKPVDRIGIYEHYWGDTHREWTSKGHIKEGENLCDHFGYDMEEHWSFNYIADLDYKPQVVEESEDTVLIRDGNGALLRRHKKHDSTPEHVDFLVKERDQWEELIKPKLQPDRRRINFEGYRKAKENARKNNRFFVWSGVNVFEQMHPVCGHEYLLMGMALDPDWVKDMVNTYAQLNIDLMEILFAEEGKPDGVWFYEDMGYKEHPFMSPAMYKEIIQPGHIKTIQYAKSRNMPVIMHSCGFVEPLVPGMIEAGVDCLQVIEVKAGMDLLRLYKNYGGVLSFMGGIDVRTLYSNDREIINREIESKIPEVMKKFGYILHSDHSIPNTVDYNTYKYFIEKALKLGTY